MGDKKIDIIIIGAGPAGLMTALTASKEGFHVLVIEQKRDITRVTRTCSAQLVLDKGYEGETIYLKDQKIIFTENQFEVPYTGRTIEILHNNYFSPRGYKVQFAHKDMRPCSIKFEKGQLLKGLREQCEKLGVEFMFECLAYGGSDNGDLVQVEVRNKGIREVITGKKLVIAEGANAKMTGVFGFNEGRQLFGRPYVEAFTLIGTNGFEAQSWNQFYGNVYHPFSEIIVGASIEGKDAIEVTVTGTKGLLPEILFMKMIKESPIRDNFVNAEIIGRSGCNVKSYVSISDPCKNNVLVIGDSAAHVEVVVQGALMCGYQAGCAVLKELKGEDGFSGYTDWWQKSFEFNRMNPLEFVKFYGTLGIKARFTDDEIDYLFKLLEGKRLCGDFSQFEVPKNLWRELLTYQEKMKIERPDVYEKVKPIRELQEKGLL